MTYAFPAIYNFPPFYTRQPNETTWKAQVQQWSDLVVGYCKHERVWALSSGGIPLTKDRGEHEEDEVVEEEGASTVHSLFSNAALSRSLKASAIAEVFQYMVNEGTAGYVDATKLGGVVVYWNRLEDWASMILDWVEKTGQLGSILTVFELQASDAVRSQPFYQIHRLVLERALEVLVKRGRAQVLRDEGVMSGVKIV